MLLAALGLGVSVAAKGKRQRGGLSIPPPPAGGPVARLAADPAHFATLALASTHALLPLIHGHAEWGVRTAVAGAGAVVVLGVVPGVCPGGVVETPFLRRRAAGLAALLAATELYASLLHPLLLGPDRLPFIPLAATSLACALGLVGEWGLAAWAWVKESGRGKAAAPAAARRKRR